MMFFLAHAVLISSVPPLNSYPGFPHGMPTTTEAATINHDPLEWLAS